MAVRLIPPMLAGSGHGRPAAPPTSRPPSGSWRRARSPRLIVGGKRSAWARHGNKVVVLVQGNGQPWKYAAHWAKHEIKDQGSLFAYIYPRDVARQHGRVCKQEIICS